ncbi:MAG: acetoin utilization protein AcuC [Paracoccaceae bacterium]
MSQPLFIGSEIYRGSTYGRIHPLAIPRVPTVIDLCRAMGWLRVDNYRTSPRAKPVALRAFHTDRYVRALQQVEETQTVSAETRERHGLGTLSNPVFPEMFRRPATAAGGSLLGAEIVAQGGVVYNPGGGTHHGLPDRANGFCYFNDPVLAIKALQQKGLQRIAYVDIDAHHCDGVEVAFGDMPEVLLLSTHEENRWPFTGNLEDRGQGNLFNLPLPRGVNDTEFDLILNEALLPAVAAHRPDAIVLQCGADAVAEDPLSRLSLSNNCHWRTVRTLADLCPRLLVLGGGGYNPWSVARLWSGVWAMLNDEDIPDRLPPEGEAILRALTWKRSAGRKPPDHWFTTLRDTANDGPISDVVRGRVATLGTRLNAQH